MQKTGNHKWYPVSIVQSEEYGIRGVFYTHTDESYYQNIKRLESPNRRPTKHDYFFNGKLRNLRDSQEKHQQK